MTYFENVIRTLERLGVADVILPFVLIFTISYAVLKKMPLFTENNFAITIALVLGLAVVFPHVTGDYRYGQDPVEIINESLPAIGVLLVLGLSILVVLGGAGVRLGASGSFVSGVLGYGSLGVVLYIFARSAGYFERFDLLRYIDSDIQALILVGAMFVFIVWFITGKEPAEGKGTFDKILTEIKNSFERHP